MAGSQSMPSVSLPHLQQPPALGPYWAVPPPDLWGAQSQPQQHQQLSQPHQHQAQHPYVTNPWLPSQSAAAHQPQQPQQQQQHGAKASVPVPVSPVGGSGAWPATPGLARVSSAPAGDFQQDGQHGQVGSQQLQQPGSSMAPPAWSTGNMPRMVSSARVISAPSVNQGGYTGGPAGQYAADSQGDDHRSQAGSSSIPVPPRSAGNLPVRAQHMRVVSAPGGNNFGYNGQTSRDDDQRSQVAAQAYAPQISRPTARRDSAPAALSLSALPAAFVTPTGLSPTQASAPVSVSLPALPAAFATPTGLSPTQAGAQQQQQQPQQSQPASPAVPAASPAARRATGHMRVASAPVGASLFACAAAASKLPGFYDDGGNLRQASGALSFDYGDIDGQPSANSQDDGHAEQAPASPILLGRVSRPPVVPKVQAAMDLQDEPGECSPTMGRSWSVASEVLRSTYLSIDSNGDGEVSKLELISAIKNHSAVAKYLLPDLDSNHLMDQEDVYDAFYEAFDSMAGGKRRATYEDFQSFVRRTRKQDEAVDRFLFNQMDKDHNGSISKFEFVSAVREYPEVASMAGVNGQDVLSDPEVFQAVSDAFNAMACGKKRADFVDFAAYAQKRKLAAASVAEVQPSPEERAQKKLLFLGCPGDIGQQHAQAMVKAGFSVQWLCNLPANAEQPGFPMTQVLKQIQASIHELQPDAVMCASRGGIYVSALLMEGLWSGPTLMLNAHPACSQLPKNARVLVVHGENDEHFQRTRAELERLVTSGSPNMCYLHFVGNSGVLPGYGYSRPGDDHSLMSLVTHDSLARLLDATLSNDCPELHMLRSSLSMLSIQRRKAEKWLGYTPDRIRRLWSHGGANARTHPNLVPVEACSEEWAAVEAVFKAMPNERAAYGGSPAELWERIRLCRVERVQNTQQAERGAKPYLAAVKDSVESQGLCFEPGVQTRWAFHGTSAVESIVSDPVAGFQPLAAGTKGQSLWGCGTYFARDAKYVLDGSFGGPPAADGSRRMLLCLITVGMYCQGDPRQKGILPMRCPPHRYDSTVDSLSSPEVHILQHSGAAYPAYVLTYYA